MDDHLRPGDDESVDDSESAPEQPTSDQQAEDRLIADIAPAGSGLDENLETAVQPIVISTLRTLSN